VVDRTEGWFLRCVNLLDEDDPARHRWMMLPDGDVGLRAPEGPIAEEHNLVALDDGALHCMYRTVAGHPCHAVSRDGGHTWTPPAKATYEPAGRPFENPRACPRLWRTSDGRFLFWFHHHGGRDFRDRNPAWISGGIERDGAIHWSQPEILLYDDDPTTRISYPDLLERDGRYWVTETQKEIARVHEIDAALLEGLWTQGTRSEVARAGLALELEGRDLRGVRVDAPHLPDLRARGGFSVELALRTEEPETPRILLDGRTAAGRGLVVLTTEDASVRIELDDGETCAVWDGDPGILQANRLHHVVITVDAGPRIITFVVDGRVGDGGERQYGWGRFPEALGAVDGAPRLSLAPELAGSLPLLRVYGRPLTSSEAIANRRAFHAGR